MPGKKKLGTGAIIGIVIGAVVIACCGITGVAALVTDAPKPDASSSASPTVAAAAEDVAPTTPAAVPSSPTPPPVSVAPTTAPAP
ncbi:hypothetical protein E1211_22650, partial [Micromonospora sp. 15K316]